MLLQLPEAAHRGHNRESLNSHRSFHMRMGTQSDRPLRVSRRRSMSHAEQMRVIRKMASATSRFRRTIPEESTPTITTAQSSSTVINPLLAVMVPRSIAGVVVPVFRLGIYSTRTIILLLRFKASAFALIATTPLTHLMLVWASQIR